MNIEVLEIFAEVAHPAKEEYFAESGLVVVDYSAHIWREQEFSPRLRRLRPESRLRELQMQRKRRAKRKLALASAAGADRH